VQPTCRRYGTWFTFTALRAFSQFAFCVWLMASLLVTTHAIATRAGVFIVLGAVQILATGVILVYATRYASSTCGSHGGERFDPRLAL
jgi:hypothetical protein